MVIAVSILLEQAKPTTTSANVQVHDGDSFRLNGQKIRLYAIDAPELLQTCQNSAGSWACGSEAKLYLESLIGPHNVSCIAQHASHDRVVARCTANDKDLSKEMVAAGYAIALSHISQRYVNDETQAQKDKKGLWQGSFERPGSWRQNH